MAGFQWCPVCGTDHLARSRCPGELAATGPESEGWKITVETPRGMQGYAVLLAPVGRRFRARILTYPNILWTVPGGGGSIKFLGATAADAERKAVAFIREHCAERSYVMRDELELCEAAVPGVAARWREDSLRAPRFDRRLPVRFGTNRPTVQAATGNLSKDGLFVATEHPMEEGQLVGLLLELEHCKVPLRGSVVWQRRAPDCGRPAGMGLRLLDPPPVYQTYVRALA
jgi:hypothetical protein